MGSQIIVICQLLSAENLKLISVLHIGSKAKLSENKI
jgi:hypothetical protein